MGYAGQGIGAVGYSAAVVARQLGIDSVEAEATPASKIERVRALRAGGESVVMAGDGINDAPALAAANVGIAMATVLPLPLTPAST